MNKIEKLLIQFIRIKSRYNTYNIIVQHRNGVQLDDEFYSLEDIVEAIRIVNPAFSL